jgi:rubredoxin
MVNRICPVCGHEDLHYSRLRSFGEKLKFNLIGKSPFRCHSCGWRGWFRDTAEPEVHQKPTETKSDTQVLHPRSNSGDDRKSVVGNLMSENDQQRERQKRRA